MSGRRVIGPLLALVLVTAACGRSSDESSADTATTTAPSDTTADTGGGLDAGEFGDLGVICTDGDATPVDDQTGIDGTTIHLATFADPGFSGRPGLNQEFFDTAEAFTSWCNEHGGIRGYQLQADLRDAALTEYQPRIIESCEQDFAMVGGGATFDDTGQTTRLACGLPDFAGFVVTPDAANADLVVQPVPNPTSTYAIGDLQWIEEQYPDATQKVGLFTGSIPTTKVVNDRVREAITGMGWNVVYDQEYNAGGEPTWKPFVQAMQDADVQILLYTGEPENLAALEKEMAASEWYPQVIRTDANHYDRKLVEVGGDAVQSTYIRSAFYPFELADEAPAVQEYLDLMDRYTDGGKIAYLGMQGLSAWLLFSTSANDCIDAGDLTRDCVFDTARHVTEWTGGGLHTTTDPAAGVVPQCALVIEATPDGFQVVDTGDAANAPFRCGDEQVVTLTGDYGQGARCPSGKENPLPSECAG